MIPFKYKPYHLIFNLIKVKIQPTKSHKKSKFSIWFPSATNRWRINQKARNIPTVWGLLPATPLNGQATYSITHTHKCPRWSLVANNLHIGSSNGRRPTLNVSALAYDDCPAPVSLLVLMLLLRLHPEFTECRWHRQ